MGVVHHVFNTRAARYFREYTDHINKNHSRQDTKKYALSIGKDVIKKGKIKRESLPRMIDCAIDRVTEVYSAYEIIRQDNVVTSSKLSTNFEPVNLVIASLSPGKLKSPASGNTYDALQIYVNVTHFSKNQIRLIETVSGVQINFHAIARLEEREIEKTNPINGIARNLSSILTYTSLMLSVCGEFQNFVIPYDKHLLIGALGAVKLADQPHQHETILKHHDASACDIGQPDMVPLFEIKTAVSYDELTPAQDDLRDAIEHFAHTHLDDINTVFENIFMPGLTEANNDVAGEAADRLRDAFTPITKMYAWTRHQQVKNID